MTVSNNMAEVHTTTHIHTTEHFFNIPEVNSNVVPMRFRAQLICFIFYFCLLLSQNFASPVFTHGFFDTLFYTWI